jgi:hypothetical protein
MPVALTIRQVPPWSVSAKPTVGADGGGLAAGMLAGADGGGLAADEHPARTATTIKAMRLLTPFARIEASLAV